MAGIFFVIEFVHHASFASLVSFWAVLAVG